MTKFLANLSLLIVGLFLSLGNFWFTFGLWPKSWLSFVLFFLGGVVLLLIRERVEKEKS